MLPRDPRYIEGVLEIMERIEGGVPAWSKEWESEVEGEFRGGGRPLRPDNTPFQGDNLTRLWEAGMRSRHPFPYWLTADEAHARGGVVRLASLGVTVVWAEAADGSFIDAGAGDGEAATHRFEEHTVFNAHTIDGIPEDYKRRPWELWPVHRDEPLPALKSFFEDLGLDVRAAVGWNEGITPGFDENSGRIIMPPWELFHGAAGYYRALCHEAVHWARQVRHDVFDQRYILKLRKPWEEIVADIGSAFLVRDLAGPRAAIGNHASYVNRWMGGIRDDSPRVLAAAAAAAEASVEWLHSRAPGYRTGGRMAGDDSSPLDAIRRARQFVAAAERLRRADFKSNPALIRDGLRLLVVADRIDIGVADVRNAIVAEVVLASPGPLAGPVAPGTYLDEIRRDLRRGMEQAVAAVHHRWNDGTAGGIRL